MYLGMFNLIFCEILDNFIIIFLHRYKFLTQKCIIKLAILYFTITIYLLNNDNHQQLFIYLHLGNIIIIYVETVLRLLI